MADLILPIFPLPNVVLFPKIFLPLHIFEPRYKKMVQDSIDSERKIGIVLLNEDRQKDDSRTTPFHRVGCVGEIENYEKLPQGRFNILLRGINRFEVIELIKQKPYRVAMIRLLEESPFKLKRQDQIAARDDLLKKFISYFKNVLGLDLDETRLDRQASLETVVNQIASVLDIPHGQKQALLEAPRLSSRFEQVSDIVSSSLDHADKLRRVVKKMRYIPEDPELN